MEASVTFDALLDAIETLPVDQQADLVELVKRRLAERGRARVLADVREGLAEHAAGKTRPLSVEELMREIES
jgi:hypothetical protein